MLDIFYIFRTKTLMKVLFCKISKCHLIYKELYSIPLSKYVYIDGKKQF